MPQPRSIFFPIFSDHMNHQPHNVAVLVDGEYFLKRYFTLIDKQRTHTPEQVARNLWEMAIRHVGKGNRLYRIFYYDCLPIDKKIHNPITKRAIDFKKTPQYKFRMEFFEELKKKRNLALRFGFIKDSGNWSLRKNLINDFINGKVKISDLTESDVYYDLVQKGIDMKIGVDIAFLALKKLVSQIVLISGDADFVPASKLARREGINFVLDPMWNPIDDSLFEHIDGLRSSCPRPVYMQGNQKSK